MDLAWLCRFSRWCFFSRLFYCWLIGVSSVMPGQSYVGAVQRWCRSTWGCNCVRLSLSSSVLFFFLLNNCLPFTTKRTAFQEKCFLPVTLCCGGTRGRKAKKSRWIYAKEFMVTEVGLSVVFLPPPILHYSISFQVTCCYQKAMGLRAPRALPPSSVTDEPLPVTRWLQTEQEMKYWSSHWVEGAGWSSDYGYGPFLVVTDGGLPICHGLKHPPQSYLEISLF